ncbi:uncharacterized protein LOC6576862 [Drosophila mojavensis]|uniref:Uncharacterized protein n=1 Tax=Drosophila mojavensis TaxID=7230 RepID=B4KHK9_DROMO|nr:uncharacterized protein LOC6576862 [Drosophila mojavensis]EDW12288.1 uncharacterized protein Dmoj_GI10791 [Drosophila mojavensis]
MCPNQGVEGSLLPDCHIANRVFMYSVLHSMQAEERRDEEVDAELRDRYEVFREVLHNFPIPLHARPEGAYEYNYVYDALQQQSQRRRQLSDAQSSTSMENNASESSVSLSSIVSSISDSSNLSARCDYYEDAVRSALAQLGGGSGSGPAQDKDFKEDGQLLDSSDETN